MMRDFPRRRPPPVIGPVFFAGLSMKDWRRTIVKEISRRHKNKSLGRFLLDTILKFKSALSTVVQEFNNPEKLPSSAEVSSSSEDRPQRSKDFLLIYPRFGSARAGRHRRRQCEWVRTVLCAFTFASLRGLLLRWIGLLVWRRASAPP